MSRFGETLHGGPVTAVEIARVREVVMFEEPALRERLVRFWVLLTLASAIATFGLYGDSVATVIGAMIVAPLMLPIMGLAFGISIGDARAIRSSLLVGMGGIATAIGVGYVLSFLMPAAFNPENVGQIMSRTSPRLIDLLAALATGLAGAFAIGRKDVSDTLPGVAIAISLVPPLSNVGILLGAHRPDLAAGSMLLFVTNYLAILLTGSIVFGLMGFPKAALSGRTPRVKGVAIAIVATMIVLILVPLGYTSLGVFRTNTAESRATSATEAWLVGSRYRLDSAAVKDDRMVILVRGSGRPPSEQALANSLRGQLFGMPVHVEVVPAQIADFETK